MTSSLALEALHHVTLPVSDLQRAERFYVELLGARLVERIDREAFLRTRPARAAEADADNSPLHLTIKLGDSPDIQLFLQRSYPGKSPAPHPHLAIYVDADQLDAFALRLTRAGVVCDGPRQLGPEGQASLYFIDPWGQLLELVTTGYRGETRKGPPELDTLANTFV
jgi:catechol 2,3-dioxygenase-like lactoylglutathione lyase family enzyme